METMEQKRPTVAVIGTLDTKGQEFLYLKQQIEAQGLAVLVLDCGVVGEPGFAPDISHDQVAQAAGATRQALIASHNVGFGIDAMAHGAALLVRQLYDNGEICGAISLGGGQGTFIGMTAMSLLPIGVPKVMVSTLALAVKELFTGGRDTMILDPVVDVSGLNAMLRASICQAAGAVCGMVRAQAGAPRPERPVLAATMYGVTTKCVDMLRARVEAAGYELWVFHSTGIGGPNMEELIRAGYIKGVIDLTVAEVSQTYLGGTCATISTRMEAAADMGLPTVVAPGGVDVCNFLGEESIPARYRDKGRKFHMHNPSTTLMRSDAAENAQIGRILAEKLNRSKGPVRVLLPLRGVSEYDKVGSVWPDPESDRALFDAIKEHLRSDIPAVELDFHINDRAFADALADTILSLMEER